MSSRAVAPLCGYNPPASFSALGRVWIWSNLVRLPSPGPLRERLLSLSGIPGATARTHDHLFFALFLLSFCFLHFYSLFYPILPLKSRPGPPKIVSKWYRNWSPSRTKTDPKNIIILDCFSICFPSFALLLPTRTKTRNG